MKTNYNNAQIEKLIKKHYAEIADLAPLSGGLVSQTFSFQYGDYRYIFQIGGSHEDYEKQQYISRKFGMTIPVREVVGVHKTEDGVSYCFSKFIAGRKLFDLNDRERREIAEPVIEILLRMAEVEIPVGSGYGRFDANGNAPYKTWHDFVSVIYNDKVCDWSVLSLRNYSDTVIRKAIDELQKNIRCAQIDNPCLVNGDAGSYNIIAGSESDLVLAFTI